MRREPTGDGQAIGPADAPVEAQGADAQDLGESRVTLLIGRQVQTSLELAQDGIAAVPAHAQDERKAEQLAIGLVQRGEPLAPARRQAVETGRALLADRFACHRASDGKFGMVAQETKALVCGCCFDGRPQGAEKIADRSERAPCGGSLRNPRRVLEDTAEPLGEGVGGRLVERRQGNRVWLHRHQAR